MAHLDYTRAHSATHHEVTLCLTIDEVRILQPLFAAAEEKARKRYLKYQDIHLGGEATTRQENELLKSEEAYEAMSSVVFMAQELLR